MGPDIFLYLVLKWQTNWETILAHVCPRMNLYLQYYGTYEVAKTAAGTELPKTSLVTAQTYLAWK